MSPEINLSPLVDLTQQARNSKGGVVLGEILRQSLALCMDVVAAATRQFKREMYPFRRNQEDQFKRKASELQQILEAMPEYQMIAGYGNEHQQRWANTLRLSIAEVKFDRISDSDSVVLISPTVKKLRDSLRSCLKAANDYVP